MNTPDRPRCLNCRFYSPYAFDGSGHSGLCRRMPPVQSRLGEPIDHRANAEWPQVQGDSWCGEHRDNVSMDGLSRITQEAIVKLNALRASLAAGGPQIEEMQS